MTVREWYIRMGGDYEETLRRMGKEERIKKLLGMLLRDPSYDTLCVAFEQKDAGEAFRAAHTLKGVLLNLGVAGPAKTASELTEKLRGQTEMAGAEELFEQMKAEYDEALVSLKEMLEEAQEGDV